MMKKLVLAISAGACAMSVYAESPKPIDLNVQLAGKVPSQGAFEVASIDWKSGDEIKLTPPEGWDWKNNTAMGAVKWKVKSSYGSVRMTLRAGHPVPNGYGIMPDITDPKGEAMSYFLRFEGLNNAPSVDIPLEVATAEEAARGKELTGLWMAGMYGGNAKDKRPGHSYASTATAVFETNF
ncbi:hypothetical protein [Burkholderia sola]|uniref:hypothetical protein n=1 Tax=Burkholderia sola TaxID=2843302 RepID=UPI0023DD72EC|nr:hypothetical protein [Burkholderia sola]MDF3079888.1 hypothetical protein [Burkholderia sola]